MAEAQTPEDVPEAKSRHRSPNYPAIGLPEAIERVSKFYAADRKAGAPLEVALKHMGFSGKHGKSMMVVSALKKYGLVEDVAGRVVPTQRAVEIIVLAQDDQRRQQAIREAALSPDMNRELYEQFGEDGFPSEESLAAELVAYKGFNPAAAGGYVRDFLYSMEFAALTNTIEIPVTDERDRESVNDNQALQAPAKQGDSSTKELVAKVVDRFSAKTIRRFTWPLAKEITATVEFVGGEVSASHIDLLQKYLELAKLAVGTETPAQGSSAEAKS
jgi:hypothetical protein